MGYPLLPEAETTEADRVNEEEALPAYAIQINNQNDRFNENDDLVSKIRQALDDIDQVDIRGAATNDELPLLQVPEVDENLIPEQVWELDGLFKLYLQNIGSVPYLHIDSQFNFRQPTILEDYQLPEAYLIPVDVLTGTQVTDTATNEATPTYFLKPYRFQQLRRVISRQIHYFDHPMFGMVVQIRRYQIPDFMY